MKNLPKTIDEVLSTLDLIIEETLTEGNYLGIFAYVYRRTTAGVKKAIEDGRFEDGPRMEKMDVLFANLYIKAYYDYREKSPVSASWKLCFDSHKAPLTIIQHLMIGMNAHINLDLALAAGIVMENQPIQALEKDYMTINDVLAELVEEMQGNLGKVSRLMFILDWIGQKTDEKIVNFSMKKARGQSWRVAKKVWELKDEPKALKIKEVDDNVAKLGQFVAYPKGKILRYALLVVALLETKDIKKIIAGLKG